MDRVIAGWTVMDCVIAGWTAMDRVIAGWTVMDRVIARCGRIGWGVGGTHSYSYTQPVGSRKES